MNTLWHALAQSLVRTLTICNPKAQYNNTYETLCETNPTVPFRPQVEWVDVSCHLRGTRWRYRVPATVRIQCDSGSAARFSGTFDLCDKQVVSRVVCLVGRIYCSAIVYLSLCDEVDMPTDTALASCARVRVPQINGAATWKRSEFCPITNKPLFLFRDCVSVSFVRRWWVSTAPNAAPCRGYMHAYTSADATAPLNLIQWHVFEGGRFLPVPSATITCITPRTFKMKVKKKCTRKSKKPVKRRVEGEDVGDPPHKKGKKNAKQKASSSKAVASWRGKGQLLNRTSFERSHVGSREQMFKRVKTFLAIHLQRGWCRSQGQRLLVYIFWFSIGDPCTTI